MSELTFWDSKQSGNAYKVRLLLAQLQRPHKVVELDLRKGEARTEDFRAINKFGRVPYIQDGEFGLAESGAILAWLARGTPLYPDEPRLQARIQQWMLWEQNQLSIGLGLPRFIARNLPDSPDAPALLRFAAQRGQAALEVLEEHLSTRNWIVGEAYTVADIQVFTYAQFAFAEASARERYPAIWRWLERVRATPRFIPFPS